MTVQVTWDDDAPKTGLPDEGTDTKTYDPTPATAVVEVTAEPVGEGETVTGDFSLPLVTTPDTTEVAVGSAVTVEGSGLAASSEGTLALVAADGTVLVEAPVTADASGAIPATELAVPEDAEPGDYTLRLSGGVVTVANTTVTVTEVPPVDPEVTTDVAEVEAGGTVTAAGTGFPADTAGTVGVYDTAGTAIVEAPVTTDADGGFTDAALVVPEGTAAGDYLVRATVGDATSPDVTVTVTEPAPVPTFTATPDTIDSGGDEAARTVTASGTGFPAETAGRVSIMDGTGAEVVGADVTTGTDGVLPDTALIVPAEQPAGEYAVHAAFTGVTVDDVTLTVTFTPPLTPEVTPDVTEVEAGGTVTVTGTGFPAEATGRVGISDETDEVVGADVTTDTNGDFAAVALVVPEATAPGEYGLRATVGGATSPDVDITVTTPPEPEQLPAPTGVTAGTATATEIPLTWDAVPNATGYEIESSPDGGTTWTPDATNPTDPAGSATELTPETEYQLRVTALGDGTNYTDSEPSAIVTASTIAGPEAAAKKTSRKKSTR